MRLLFTTLLGLIAFLIATACARQSSPMGGPKDEDPPLLISSNPENESLNIKPSQLELYFNEYIKIDNPTSQIIITPRVNPENVEFTAGKNRLLIKLNQELEDSTTYVFNFQKSIQDITESNPARQLKLVFSTGNEIDSLKFSGKVAYIFPKNAIEDVLVGLYHTSDTTDLFTSRPYYITQVDSAGNFEITNIKAGDYLAYAWHDDNNSNKAEHRSEAYAFLDEPVRLDSTVTGVNFNLFRGDLSELKVNRSSPVGSNFDIILNKFPVDIEVIHPDINSSLFYRIKEKTVRLYHIDPQEDSIAVRLALRDSVGFSLDTTLYAKFQPSDRTLEKLEVQANSGKGFVKNIQSILTFNKPVHQIHYDSLYIRYDTAGRIPILPIHLSLPDSSVLTQYHVNIPIPDSLNFSTYTVFASDSTFIDVENQPNETKLEANYAKIKEETLSEELSGKVNTEELPLLIQLIDRSNNVVKEAYLTESSSFKLLNMEAGQYTLRAIVDRNKNRRWDPGNIHDKRQPEPVYYFYDKEGETDQILLRGGWTLNGIVINPPN
ncbi:MAG TPA: Ig-like domain-containing domain [Cyclobacteriaceae bacterium]|nr:Ig-like domain-containing domain [Cyclobacteriaceae bacterium]